MQTQALPSPSKKLAVAGSRAIILESTLEQAAYFPHPETFLRRLANSQARKYYAVVRGLGVGVFSMW